MIRKARPTSTSNYEADGTNGYDYAAPRQEAQAHSAKVEVEKSWRGAGVKEPNLPFSIITGSFIINLAALASPLIILQIYDRIVPNQAKATLVVLMLAGIACLVLDFALKSLRSYSLGYMSSKYLHTMQVEAMQRLMYSKPGTIENTALSTHMNRFSALQHVADYHGGQSRTTAIDIPFAIIFLGLMALVGGTIALVPLVLFAVFAFVSISYNKIMNSELDKRMRFENRKYDFIIETLSGIFTVKALGLESAIQRRYERLQQNSAEGTHKMVTTSNTIQDFSAVFGAAAQIFVVAYGAVMVIDGHMSQGALACCTLLSGQVLSPLLRGVSIYTEMQTLALRRGEANQLFAQPHVETSQQDYEALGNISLEQVSLSSARGSDVNLQNITASFAKGEIIGIHSSHSHTTTALLEIIKGDLRPSAGRVTLDGHDLYTNESRSLTQNIVYVSDKSQLFRGTILENLTLFEMSRRRHAAFEAARILGIEEEISQLPEGYDTKVGEGTSYEFGADFLSRLCIARGLVALPQVLILDHIADNFDLNGVKQLCKTLEAVRGRFTIILTSADNNLMRVADKVYALREGQLYQAQMEAKPAMKTASPVPAGQVQQMPQVQQIPQAQQMQAAQQMPVQQMQALAQQAAQQMPQAQAMPSPQPRPIDPQAEQFGQMPTQVRNVA